MSSNSSSSQDSHYSCSNLDDDDSSRRVNAQKARDQVQRAPTMRNKGDSRYPEHHNNYEGHDFKLQGPLTSFPVNDEAWQPRSQPPATRAIYNENDKDNIEVVYHDKSQGSTGNFSAFSLAIYRERKSRDHDSKDHSE
ncbi:uncharacterized protein RCC_08453 [Ramularia collo-cygni]|uniref:Uncharacterized protein n=1 Tax=Ramularia collo-cygni TaxID=112498 RepID=A0A2D3VME1_9PEZI|nr:uncharacterized protein RCC_08453 [Ramularia collo-cygni]CZT22748.1 uncharacterized protein RCC_08453 [Ramularia collo-cygni]